MCRSLLLLITGLLIGFAPAPLPKLQSPEDSLRDLQAMQGTWTERFADSAAISIIGDRMEDTSDDVWKLKVNTMANPKRIAAIGVSPRVTGKTRWGLYRLEKNKLIICWSRGSVAKLEWPANLNPIQKEVWIQVFSPVKK